MLALKEKNKEKHQKNKTQRIKTTKKHMEPFLFCCQQSIKRSSFQQLRYGFLLFVSF